MEIVYDKTPSNSRRMFISKDDSYFHFFSFSQKKDGSIYCSLPFSNDAIWQSLTTNTQGHSLKTEKLDEEGKLSLHGTGMATIRAHNDQKGHKLIVKGNHLLDMDKKKIGVRHLFSAFLQEPKYIPIESPPLNKKSDYILKPEEFRPFAMVFFAVPYKENLKAEVGANFNINDLEMPPRFSFGNFSLRYHNLLWFYYYTKNMEKWPANTHFFYYDGYTVPLYIGEKEDSVVHGSIRIELRQPIYKLEENSILLSI